MGVHGHEQLRGAITLQDAAHELHINVKTLKRWLDIEGIHPPEDPRDRRRRLIDRDELNRLKQLFGEVPSVKSSADSLESQVEALEQHVNSLETALAALSARTAAMGDNIISLTQQVLELRNSNEAMAKHLKELPQQAPVRSHSYGRA